MTYVQNSELLAGVAWHGLCQLLWAVVQTNDQPHYMLDDIKKTLLAARCAELSRRFKANQHQAQTLTTIRVLLLPHLVSGWLRLLEVEEMLEDVA